jgi:hypothetical protein
MSLESDARRIQQKVARNLNFGIAKGLTKTAQFAAQKMQQQLPQIFDRPTPFTQRSIGFASASKSKLEARVFVRDIQAKYLMRQEQGGLRTPQPGSPINIAVGQRLNQYGNISRGALARQRAKPNVFASKGRGKTKHLPAGLYERPSKSADKRKKNKGLKLLVAFERKANYQPRFQFVKRVTGIARDNVKANIAVGINEAMQSIR